MAKTRSNAGQEQPAAETPKAEDPLKKLEARFEDQLGKLAEKLAEKDEQITSMGEQLAAAKKREEELSRALLDRPGTESVDMPDRSGSKSQFHAEAEDAVPFILTERAYVRQAGRFDPELLVGSHERPIVVMLEPFVYYQARDPKTKELLHDAEGNPVMKRKPQPERKNLVRQDKYRKKAGPRPTHLPPGALGAAGIAAYRG